MLYSRRDSVSFLNYFFRCQVQVLSCEILPVYLFTYLYKSFYSHFCFLVIVIVILFLLPPLTLATLISTSLLFVINFSIRHIDAYTLPSLPFVILLLFLAVVSILLYGYTTWMLTKRMEKKVDGNYTRMLRAILNKSWNQHSTKQQLYGHLSPITKTWSFEDALSVTVIVMEKSNWWSKFNPVCISHVLMSYFISLPSYW